MNPYASLLSGYSGYAGSSDGGGGLYSINPRANADSPLSGLFGGSAFGGINTGTQTQGLDLTQLAIVGGLALLALLILRKGKL